MLVTHTQNSRSIRYLIDGIKQPCQGHLANGNKAEVQSQIGLIQKTVLSYLPALPNKTFCTIQPESHRAIYSY